MQRANIWTPTNDRPSLPRSLDACTLRVCIQGFFFKGEHLQPEESSFQQLDLFARERNPIFLAESYFRPDCPSPLNGQKVEDEEARERASGDQRPFVIAGRRKRNFVTRGHCWNIGNWTQAVVYQRFLLEYLYEYVNRLRSSTSRFLI